MSSIRRHWKWWLGGGIALVVIVAVVAPYVYIHFIEGKAPDRFELSDRSTTSNGSSASTEPESVDGTWQVGEGSRAGYRVNEILFGQHTTAVGRTADVTGQISISRTSVPSGTFTVDLTTVKSDRSQRDHQFQGRIMDVSKYPKATFVLSKPIALGSVPAVGKQIMTKATGQLTMHGTTRTVTLDLQAQRLGSGIEVVGSLPVTFRDWNIPNPSFGPVSTEDHGVLEVRLELTKAA